MSENRKLTRKKAPDTIAVFDCNTHSFVGHIVNMTIEGALLISDQPIPIGTVLQLRMSLPEPVEGVDSVEFGAECLWDSPANDDNTNWVGLQIIDVSERNSQVIDSLIKDWAG